MIFAALFVCRLLRASAAYFNVMYKIVVFCQRLALNDALYLLKWAIVRAYWLFSAVLPECRLLRLSVDIKRSYVGVLCLCVG